MTGDAEPLVRLLHGRDSHAPAAAILEALDDAVAAARPDGWPYSCHEILLHVVYWQDLFLDRLAERPAPLPAHAADGWPAPGGASWIDTAAEFARGLAAAEAVARSDELDGRLTGWRGIRRRDGLAILAQHNSYHLGQIVLLRRVLGAWPPPSGGDTW